MIPAEAVEAAAKGLAVWSWGDWGSAPDALRRMLLCDARRVLEAAAPHMYQVIPAEAVEELRMNNAMTPADDLNHEVDPGWSVLYDNYRCRVCGVWAYREAESGAWKHGGEG